MAYRGRAGIVVAALLALTAASADAKQFKVNTAADHKPGKCTKGDCTLREAVIAANERDGLDKLTLPASKGPYDLERDGADVDAAETGDLDLTDPVEIKGAGGRAVIKQRTDDRVFHTHSGISFDYSLSKLTITGGSGVVGGGGVFVEHNTFLYKSVVRDNRAENGGGVAALGTDARVSINLSTVAGNRATDSGGGLYVSGYDGDSTSGLSLSTVARNRAPVGGGVYALLGDANLNVNNSTVALNEAAPGTDATAGGLYLALTSGAGVTKLAHATIASNEAPSGAGHAANLQVLGTAQLENTIVAGPVGAPSCTFDVDSFGHNLDDATSCGLDQGSDLEDADAGLKRLDDYGGLTETMALKGSSDANETGNCPGALIAWGTDQRGEGRGTYPICDIGAFERPGD